MEFFFGCFLPFCSLRNIFQPRMTCGRPFQYNFNSIRFSLSPSGWPPFTNCDQLNASFSYRCCRNEIEFSSFIVSSFIGSGFCHFALGRVLICFQFFLLLCLLHFGSYIDVLCERGVLSHRFQIHFCIFSRFRFLFWCLTCSDGVFFHF